MRGVQNDWMTNGVDGREQPFGERGKGIFDVDTGVLQSHTLYFGNSARSVRVDAFSW